MTTALSVLVQRMSEYMGDWLEFDTTTNITGSDTNITSTTLNQYDSSVDDTFNDWWAYITEGTNNADVERKVENYTTSGGVADVYGANLGAESAAVTVQLHRYKRTDKEKAINRALEELYPALHKPLDNMELITGNILPVFNWSTTALLDVWTEPTGTLTKTTSTYVRYGETSASVDASGADDVLYVSSDDYPRLLDVMNHSVDFKCWVYPENANDAFLTIATTSSDGTTTQTLNSTTTCPAGYWTQIKLEDQTINDDLSKIEFRLRVHTSGGYVYFDAPRATGRGIREYLLPKDFQGGSVDEVYIQSSGYSEDACDDLHPARWDRVFGYDVINDGTYGYLRLQSYHPNNLRIRLIGSKPLAALSAATDTIYLDAGGRIDLIIQKAIDILMEMTESPVSKDDISRFETERAKRRMRVAELTKQHRMMSGGTLKLP